MIATTSGATRRLATTVLAFASTVAVAATSNRLPNGVVLPKDVAVPNDTAIAIYLPAHVLAERFYANSTGIWVEPGRALDSARSAVGEKFFSKVMSVTPGLSDNYGLLLDIDPEWGAQNGSLHLDLRYKVYGADATELMSGTQSTTVAINSGGAGGGFANAANRATQQLLVDVLTKLRPSASKYPATSPVNTIKADLIVDRSKPVSTGTAFYINKSGQLLTAAHVVDSCLVVEAQRDDVKLPVTLNKSSKLLDLAVVDTGKPVEAPLVLRRGQDLILGEAVTDVGYPLAGILSATPNVTRGNVSARAGLKGSVGLFQFSAPIQPGASGGPVVSDGGELLGVAVSTLNSEGLIKAGILPQNVNFALDARYAAKFLREAKIDFIEVEPRKGGDLQTANAAALGAVVQLNCFQ